MYYILYCIVIVIIEFYVLLYCGFVFQYIGNILQYIGHKTFPSCLVALNGLEISQYSTLNIDSMVQPHKFCTPIAKDVRSNRKNTSVNRMTNNTILIPTPYPYPFEPWNNDKNQKICPNITDEFSPLSNQKSYLHRLTT